MSLLRLLTTGKSLVGMSDTNSRYRMRTRRALPKFGPAKNPFAAPTPGSETPGGSAGSSPAKLETASLFESDAPQPVSPKPAKPAPAKQPKTPPPQPTDAAAPAKIEARPVTSLAPLVPSRKPSRSAGWLRKLNPLLLLPPWRADGGRSRPARKAVQTELTLEKIRVVRNDLSDTDLEIVPGRLMGLPSGASPILPHNNPSELGAWSRLTSKFLGTQQTQIR
jgi:hypothetical protein